MKVRDLIECLQEYDQDAEVYIMEQPSWPFEYSISGVISRDEVRRDEGIEGNPDEEEVVPDYQRFGAPEYKLPGTDVFILEGPQLRYGNKNSWNV